jgi:hypothetical protein
MADARAGNPAQRVVILSPDGALRAALGRPPGEAECIPVASPYEAAAELIAAPALAIVIDLRLMGPGHLRLLQIARERGVEMLAMGGIPSGLTAEDLSGVRLLARADLKAAMEKLLQDRQGRYEAAPPPETKQAAPVPAARPPSVAPPAAPAGSRPAQAGAEGTKPAPSPAPRPEPPSAPPAEGPRSILSPEELAALLEEQP